MSTVSPPPTLWELFKWICIGERGHLPGAMQEMVRQWGPIHPDLKDHPALPIIRHFIRERWGKELSRETYNYLRDLICSVRELGPQAAQHLSLDEIAAVLGEVYRNAVAGERSGMTGDPMSSVSPSASVPSGLICFDLQGIFRSAVELGDALSTESALHADGATLPSEEWRQWSSGDPDARQQLRGRVNASRQCETAMARLMAVLNPSRAQFPREWKDAVDLADALPAARQAMLTLGLALADLRGDPQWHDRGRELLSAGTWNLWDGLEPADRNAVHHLLEQTHRLWGWPTDPFGEPEPFTGLTATMSDPRILVPTWRTVTPADLDAVNDFMRSD
jgi:hypothetical protein